MGIFGTVQPQPLNHRGHRRQRLAPARLAMLLTLACLWLAVLSPVIAGAQDHARMATAAALHAVVAPADDGTPPFESLRTQVGKVRRNLTWAPQSSPGVELPRSALGEFVLALNTPSPLLAVRHHCAPAHPHSVPAIASAPPHQYPPGQAPPRNRA